MSNVFVIDTCKRPLDPVHPGRARLLLKEGKAAVYRRYPFCIILKTEVIESAVQPLRIKLDPGSRTTAKGNKKVQGFQTGDIVKAIVTTGTKKGTYIGRVAVRSTGSFNVRTPTQTVQGINHRSCHMLHRSDGYRYAKGGVLPPYA